MGKMKYFLMHPPKWLERLLSRIPQYRGWYIKNVCHILHEEVMKSIE